MGTSETAPSLRAVGVRCPYADVAPSVRSWIEDALSSRVVEATDQVGGMSPGCAARLRTQAGRRVFVKAVGRELNPDTPGLFRHEAGVLGRLSPQDYRAALLAAYDDGDWVALLIEDVEGRHPDLAAPGDYACVKEVVARQAAELTPSPVGSEVGSFADVARRWAGLWSEPIADHPATYLPAWAVARFDELRARVESLPARLSGSTLAHFDIRDDNLLIRPDGRAVIFDWGMARIGPDWADLFVLALNVVDRRDFDREMEEAGADSKDTVTDALLAWGGAQSWNARRPERPGLPTLAAYCKEDARRLLVGARRRLS